MNSKRIILLPLLPLLSLIALPNTEGKWCTRLKVSQLHNDHESGHKTEKQNVNTTEIEQFCCTGYYLNGTECVSVCKEPCANGFCIETGECVCHPGYTRDSNASNECLPVCVTKCEYGKCLKPPDTCECYTGYEFNIASKKCKPVCKSNCAADDSDIGMSSINNANCNRICTEKCRSGKCFSPGHIRQNNQGNISISPTSTLCSLDCGYGECLKPGATCQCHKGYDLNNVTLLCEPLCSTKCPSNSKCVQPNVCECDRGFNVDPLTKNRCKSLNSKVFIYAGSLSRSSNPSALDRAKQILQPELCEAGFELNVTSLRCQPSCHNGCLNGNCASPDVCICWRGYSMEALTHTCQLNPCKTPCPNGYCIPVGDCVCPEGWTKGLTRGSGCEPLFGHTIQVMGIFLCIIAVMIVIIWMISVAERRRRIRRM